MKKVIILPLILLALSLSMAMHGETATSPSSENLDTQDSTLNVIGWFNRLDTAVYWVSKTSWEIKDNDTTQTALYTMKVRVNVVDSTADGYKMDYTILEVPVDPLSDSSSVVDSIRSFMITLISKIAEGTTVRFETDDCGRITEYTNLDQIKEKNRGCCRTT